MNYQKIYNHLIERAKTRTLDQYKERHHIIPRCMEGTDNLDNLVDLTPEEHYVAHQLLVKIYPENSSLVYAAKMMCLNLLGNRSKNKLYGWLRKRHSEIMSETWTGKSKSRASVDMMVESRRKNGSYGPLSDDHKEKLSKAAKRIPKSEKAKQNMKGCQIGKVLSEETRQKISEKNKGKSSPNKGKKLGPLSDETREKCRLAKLGKKRGPYKKRSSSGES